jgi:hypothetical protein
MMPDARLRAIDHFAGAMRTKVALNAHKGDWLKTTDAYLLQRLRQETEELSGALATGQRSKVESEAADVANFAMMLADPRRGLDGTAPPPRPTIVTLCGSTRFREQYLEAQRTETLLGRIVISVGLFGHLEGLDMESGTKQMLDALHKRKIDLSDEILVINVGGYVGNSTRGEIQYAEEHGKRVRYWETVHAP